MTERPYTDTDLRAEAARQHCLFIKHFNSRLILGRMLDNPIESTRTDDDTLTWREALSCDQYDGPTGEVADLIRGAVDVSEWAVNLGADNLQPSTEHEITLNAGRTIARIHFAFEPGMPEEMRTDLVEGIGDAINEAGAEREGDVDEEPVDVDSDSDVFDLISEIASRLRDATDSGEYHAVGLIYDLAMSRTTVAEARAELDGIEFGHV
ncbi:hypothetical protein [Streptomyces sp. STCH 565 A]|uniref:hypothetical protein n=1 Tax=Streptomyces sp. STCH 565 A TaxID=2950532 RepID=UPI00207580A8|nr:hypothetical protein [Streptomyces sp. STCH 565 A]MCM8552646.1 hypothetical protein [Streptomyces sp. STCH 565 A]